MLSKEDLNMDKKETQVHNPKSNTWVKRDRETGQFIGAQKQPYQDVPKEREEEEN
jgi:hypothetical protein